MTKFEIKMKKELEDKNCEIAYLKKYADDLEDEISEMDNKYQALSTAPVGISRMI